MDNYLKSFLTSCIGHDSEFDDELRKQLAAINMDVNQLVDIAVKGLETYMTPIPSVLHSLYDGPFKCCLVCKTELLSPAKEYLIVRMFRDKEPTTEYAICSTCNYSVWKSFSEDTCTSIAGEFNRNINWEERQMRLVSTTNASDFDIESWIAYCLLTGKPRGECDYYQIIAHCVGPNLALWKETPWMRSGDSLRHTWKLWSKESREDYNDFVEKFLGPTPSLAKEAPRPIAIELLSI